MAEMAGLFLDPWQKHVLDASLGEREDGSWSAFEVCCIVPRQNGKGSILEARELAGVFTLGEQMIVHSAHQFDTSQEHFRRLLFLLEDAPDLDREVHRVARGHGDEGIEFKNGSRIRFRTRTKGGGRGFSADCLVLDEAMFLPESALAATLPILSARKNPQVWYTGSAVDQDVHQDGLVLSRVRHRGHQSDDPRLAFFEWAADGEIDDPSPSREKWAQANPGLGIRIAAEHIESEFRSMAARTFAVERLGIGDWPSIDGADGDGITPKMWRACRDPQSKPKDPVCFAFDVTPSRDAGTIAVAGFREDEKVHVEVVAHRKGTGWIPDELARLLDRHDATAVVCDESGPAASLLKPLENREGVEVLKVGAREYAQACGALFDAVEQKTLRHLGTDELESAIRGAARRPLVDSWAWTRRKSVVDISPLVAATLALWGVVSSAEEAPFLFDVMA